MDFFFGTFFWDFFSGTFFLGLFSGYFFGPCFRVSFSLIDWGECHMVSTVSRVDIC